MYYVSCVRSLTFFSLLLLLLIPSGIFSALTSDIHLSGGFAFEYNMYGQPGVVAALSHEKVLGGHPQLRLQYTTSGLSLWNGPNALTVNDLYLNASWVFGPYKKVNSYAGIDIGQTWFDLEDEEVFRLLDNTAMRLNLRTGVCFSVWGGRVLPYIDGGYALLLSSTTFPLFFSCGVQYSILNGGK